MRGHEGRNELLGVFHSGNKKYETLSLQCYLTILCEGKANLPPSSPKELSNSDLNELSLEK